MNAMIVLGYILLCFAVAAVVRKYLKTTWVFFIVAATLPPMLLTAFDALWRGYLDTWAGIGFIVAWLTAFGCALVYYLAIKLAAKKTPAIRSEPD